MRPLVVPILLYFALLLAHQANGVTICDHVKNIGVLGSIDGFGAAFSNVSWLSSACQATSDFNSGWINVPAQYSLVTKSTELAINELLVRRTLKTRMSTDTNNAVINITIEFRVTTSGENNINAKSHGFITKSLSGIPMNAISFQPISWRGIMYSSCQENDLDCSHVVDQDLFNGSPPSILLPTETNEYPYDIIELVQQRVSDVNLLLGPLDAAVSALHGTVRGCFMPNKNPTITSVIHGIDSALGRSTFVSFRDSCQGAECGSILISSIQDLLSEASQGKCSSMSNIQESISSSVDVEIAVASSNSSIHVRNLLASTRATFNCGSLYFGIEVTARGSYQSPWPLDIFLTDTTAMVAMIKAIKLNLNGNIYGAVQVGDQLFTVVSGDLFSIGRGGALIPDRAINSTLIQSALTQIKQKISTEVDLVNAFIDDLLGLSDITALINRYKSTVSVPRLVDFFQWLFRNEPRVTIVVSADGSEVTLLFSIGEKIKIPFDHSFITAANAKLDTFGSDIRSQSVSANAFVIPSISETDAATLNCLLQASVTLQILDDSSNILRVINSTIDFTGAIDIRAKFSTLLPGMFSSASFMQLIGGDPYIVAEIGGGLSSILGSHAIHFNELFLDMPFNDSRNVISAVENILGKLADNPWTMSALQPFTTNFGSIVPNTNFYNGLSWLASLVKDPGATTVTVARKWISQIQQITDKVPNLIVFPKIEPGSNLMKLSLQVHELASLSIPSDRTQWKSLGTARLSVPTLVKKTLESIMNFENVESSLLNVGAKALSKLSNWVVPLRHQMISGVATDSLISVDIDLPSFTNINLHLNLLPDRGEKNILVDIFGDKLLDTERYPEFKLLTNNTITIDPSNILSSIKDGLMQFVPLLYSGALNFPIPPMKESLGAMYSGVSSLIEDEIVPWLLSAVDDDNIFTIEVCINAPQDLSLNFTINGVDLALCPFDFTSYDSLQDLNTALTQNIKSCRLDTFIIPKITKQINETCGEISIMAAVRGVIRSLQGLIAGEHSVQFNAPQAPSFGSWRDLLFVLRTVLKAPWLKIEEATVPLAEVQGLLPVAFQKIFNDTNPAVFLDVTIPLGNNENVLASLAPNLISQDGALALNMPDNLHVTAQLTSAVHCRLGVVFNVPGTNDISAFSDLHGEDSVTLQTVIEAGNNTFDLRVQAQYRSLSSQYLIEYSNTIVLTPGVTFEQSVTHDIVSQVNDTIRDLLNITVEPSNELLGLTAQIRIAVVRKQIDEETWILPVELSITNSRVPGLSNFVNRPSSSHVVVSGLSVNGSLNAAATFDTKIHGVLGILNLRDSDIEGSVSASVGVAQMHPYTTMSAVGSALVNNELFDRILQADVELHSNMSIFGYSLSEIENLNLSELPTIGFLVDQAIAYANATVLSRINQEVSKWRTHVMTAREDIKQAFESLSQLNQDSLCNWTSKIYDAAETMGDKSLTLPFTSASLEDVITPGLLEVMSKLKTVVCEAKTGLTMQQFCDAMNRLWNQEICRNAILTYSSFKFDLELEGFNREFTSSVSVDVGKIFGSKHAALTGATALTVLGNFSFYLPLEALFSTDGVSLRIGDEYRFEVDVAVDGFGTARAYIGPLALTLADLRAYIGSPAKLLAQKGTLSLTGEAAFSAVVNLPNSQCRLSIAVPDISRPFSDPSTVITECRDGFLKLLEDALQNSPLINYFSSPSRLLAQMEEGLNSMLDSMFTATGSLNYPLIGRLFEELIRSDVLSLVGSGEGQEIIRRLANMTSTILQSNLNPAVIDQVTLQGFTEILCIVYKPKHCPAPPQLGAGLELRWPLQLARSVNRPITNLNFGLGAHGFAALALECSAQLQVTFDVNFTLIYSLSHGIQVLINDDQILISANANLDLSACHLKGKIGFLGADLGTDEKSGVRASFTLTNNGGSLRPDLNFAAEINGALELGLAGSLKSGKSGVQNAVPHWQARARFYWPYSLESNTVLAPVFTLTDLNMCTGTVLADMVREIISAADPIFKPFNNVLGRDGILLKRIEPTRYIFGRPLTLVELLRIVAREFCSSCAFDGVFECIEAFLSINEVFQSVQRFKDLGVNGCQVTQAVQSFNLNFQTPRLDPELFGPLPDGSLFAMDPSKLPLDINEIRQSYSRITVEGKFGVRFPLVQNIPQKVISLLLGQDIRVVEFVIPAMTIAAGVNWPIPVWPVPLVTLNIGISASVRLDINRVIFTSKGIRHLIETGSPGSLLSSLAIPTVRDDGSPLWQLQGTVRLTGGVTVSIFVVKGSAYVFLQFDAMARIPDLYGRGFVTFDELASAFKLGGLGVLQRRLQLAAGFGLRLQACIPLVFKTVCRTIVSIERSAIIWAAESTESRTNPRFADHAGSLNLDAVAANSKVVVYDNHLEDTRRTTLIPADGSISRSVDTSAANPVGYSGSPRPLEMEVRYVKQLVNLPQNALLRFVQSANNDARRFIVRPNGVSSDSSSMGVAINEGCSQLLMESPKAFSTVSFSGLPCNTQVKSLSTVNVALDGDASQYQAKSLVIEDGARDITSRIQDTVYEFSAASIKTPNGLDLTFAADSSVPSITAFGHFTLNSTFLVKDCPPSRSLTVVGGSGNNIFDIPDVSTLRGLVTLRGGTSHVNYLDLDILASTTGLNVVTGPSSLVYQHENTILWENIKSRKFNIDAKAGTSTSFTLLRTEDHSTVEVVAKAEAGSDVSQYITGCSGSSELRVQLENDGNHVVYIGNNDEISDFACTLRITGGNGPTQVDTVVIQASDDKRHLQWTVNRERLVVFDATSSTRNYFIMFFSSIERVVINANNRTSAINFVEGTSGTEFVFNFPESVEETAKTWICTTTDAIFIKGSTNLFIGPNAETCGIVYSPDARWDTALSHIDGLLAIDATTGPVNVFLSHQGSSTVPQRYSMTDSCLTELNSNYNVTDIVTPSSWICDQLTNFGATCPTCQVSYVGDVTFSITTGPADDYFIGTNLRHPLTLDTSQGNDTIQILSTSRSLNISTGPGRDLLSVTYPLSIASVDLGSDSDEDYVNILTQGMNPMPQVFGSTVGPTNTMNNDSITFSNWKVKDTVHARFGTLVNPFMKRAVTEHTSVIDLQNDGGEFKLDMISDATYLLVGCSSPSTVTFLANNTGVSATSWTLNVTLPAIDEPRYLNVLSEKGNNGVVNVLLPMYIDSTSNNLFTGYTVSTHLNGSFNAFGLRSLLLNVDHIAVTSRELIFATLMGAPSNAEMVLNAQTGSSLDAQQLTSPLLAVNLQAVLSPSVLLGPMTFVAYGSGSVTYLNCTFTEQVSFDGCLLLNKTTARTTSAWFKTQLDLFNIPHSNAEHVFCAYDTQQVTISSQTVNAIIPSFEPPSRVLIIDNGNLNLRDAVKWTNASITATHLRVEPRYRVELDDQFKAAADIHFAPAAVMTVTCNTTNEEYAQFILGTNQPSFDWFGPSCFGSIGTFEIPNLNFTGSGMTIANMNLSALREVANNSLVTITDRIFTLDNETRVKFNEEALNMSWSVHMSTLNHSILLVDSAPWCQLVVSGTASTIVTSVVQHHVVFPGRDLVYHYESKLLEPFDIYNDSTCLRPNEMCSPNFWIDIQAHGTYLCEPKCSSYDLTINTTLAVECDVPLFSEGWSILIAAQEYVTPGPNIPIILFAVLYFSLIGLTALSNAFDGLMFFGGWAECVITGALFTVNSIENYWNLDIRSLIVSANEIIDGIFESWLCDKNMAFEIPAWALLACAGVVLIVSLLQMFHDAGNNIYVRVAKSLTTASLLVFLPYFITRVGMLSWPEMFPIGVLLGRFIFDAFYPAVPWSRTMILQNFENSPEGDRFTLKERIMNGAVNLALPVICAVASTLTRTDISIEPMTATWILFSLVALGCGASVLRIILFTSSAPRLMHQQLALPAQIIAFVMIGLSAGSGLTLVALLHYLPTLPTIAFVALWCGWVVLLALVPVLFAWRKIERPQPKSQRNSEYVLLDEFDNSVVKFHNKL